MKGVIISLFDYSGITVRPWLESGYWAIMVDVQHRAGIHKVKGQKLWKIGCEIRQLESFLVAITNVVFVAAYPPCTDLAGSGARWWKDKRKENPDFQKDAMELFWIAKRIADTHNAPYFIENPIGAVSTLWRKPDYYWHPFEYDGYTDEDDNYTKRTCLWTGNGFVMPEPKVITDSLEPDDRIHKAAPGPERKNFRSKTPDGFARAIYLYNKKGD